MAGNRPKPGIEKERYHRAVMRDLHQDIILVKRSGTTNQAELNAGLWFPDPDNLNQPFQFDFHCTQIIITGTANFYWMLETNLDSLGQPTANTTLLYGSYIATTMNSLPLTVRLYMQKDKRARFMVDSGLGGVAGPGNWRVQLLGYYEQVYHKKG